VSPDGDSSWNGGQLPQTMALTSFELRVGGSDPFKAKTRATGSICDSQLDLKADGKVGFGPLGARRVTEIGLQVLFLFPLASRNAESANLAIAPSRLTASTRSRSQCGSRHHAGRSR
jgi:hypothetical protein